MNNNVLIIIAHPDDEILGMGGTIQKLIKNGKKISVLLLSKPGNARKNEDPNLRLNVFKDIMLDLGITEVFYSNFPDTSFDSVKLLDIIRSVEDVLEKIKPNIVYTHFYNDLNIDHNTTSRAVITALRPIEKYFYVKKIFLFEIPSSTELSIGLDKFSPNYFVDISNFIDKKIKFLSMYYSELRGFPHPFSIEGINTYSKFRGMQSGLNFAEAFFLYRALD